MQTKEWEMNTIKENGCTQKKKTENVQTEMENLGHNERTIGPWTARDDRIGERRELGNGSWGIERRRGWRFTLFTINTTSNGISINIAVEERFEGQVLAPHHQTFQNSHFYLLHFLFLSWYSFFVYLPRCLQYLYLYTFHSDLVLIWRKCNFQIHVYPTILGKITVLVLLEKSKISFRGRVKTKPPNIQVFFSLCPMAALVGFIIISQPKIWFLERSKKMGQVPSHAAAAAEAVDERPSSSSSSSSSLESLIAGMFSFQELFNYLHMFWLKRNMGDLWFVSVCLSSNGLNVNLYPITHIYELLLLLLKGAICLLLAGEKLSHSWWIWMLWC